MSDKNHKIQIFNGQKVRTVWNADEEKWYFSIVDVVAVLTDSADPKQYIKKMKMRDPELKNNWGTICTLVELVSSDGKKHKEMTWPTSSSSSASSKASHRQRQSPSSNGWHRWQATASTRCRIQNSTSSRPSRTIADLGTANVG